MRRPLRSALAASSLLLGAACASAPLGRSPQDPEVPRILRDDEDAPVSAVPS